MRGLGDTFIPGPTPPLGSSPYETAAGAAYYQTMVLTGSSAQATIAARAAVGLPAAETADEALDRLVKMYDAGGDSAVFRSLCAQVGLDPTQVIAEHDRRIREYNTKTATFKNFVLDAAGVAAIACAAVFLGPQIASKFGATTAAGTTGGTTAATTTGVVAATQKALGVVNTARTVDAVAKGEAPPPPVNLTGSNFIDWSKSLGMSVLKDKMAENQQELSAAQQQQAAAQMDLYIRSLVQQAVASGTPNTGTPNGITDPGMLNLIAQEQQKQAQQSQLIKVAVIGGAAILGASLLFA